MAVKFRKQSGTAMSESGQVLNGATVKKGQTLVNRNVTVGGKNIAHEILGVSGASVTTTGWKDAVNPRNGIRRNSRFRRSQVVAGPATAGSDDIIVTALTPKERTDVRPRFREDDHLDETLVRDMQAKGYTLPDEPISADGMTLYCVVREDRAESRDMLENIFGKEYGVLAALESGRLDMLQRAITDAGKKMSDVSSWEVTSINPLVIKRDVRKSMNVDAVAGILGSDHPAVDAAYTDAMQRVKDTARIAINAAQVAETVDVSTVNRKDIDKGNRVDPLEKLMNKMISA